MPGPVQPHQTNQHKPTTSIDVEKGKRGFSVENPEMLSAKALNLDTVAKKVFAMAGYVIANILTVGLFFLTDYAVNNPKACTKRQLEKTNKLEENIHKIEAKLEDSSKKIQDAQLKNKGDNEIERLGAEIIRLIKSLDKANKLKDEHEAKK